MKSRNPKWELPQPMDSLLFGTQKRTTDEDVFDTKSKIITFYDNNKYVLKTIGNDDSIYVNDEYLWQVDNDTLILSFRHSYTSYKYNVSADGKLLYVEEVRYPNTNRLDYPVYVGMLGTTPAEFKRFVEKQIKKWYC